MSSINIRGLSGAVYGYEPHPMSSNWNDVGGNYIFAQFQAGLWYLLYVGQCDSFRNRLPNHERWAEAVGRGATHVLAQVNQLEPSRLRQESDIIRRYQPPMNVQHRAA